MLHRSISSGGTAVQPDRNTFCEGVGCTQRLALPAIGARIERWFGSQARSPGPVGGRSAGGPSAETHRSGRGAAAVASPVHWPRTARNGVLMPDQDADWMPIQVTRRENGHSAKVDSVAPA